jgi:hypothetical protein
MDSVRQRSSIACSCFCVTIDAGLIVAVVTAAGYPGADGARKFVPAFFVGSFSV